MKELIISSISGNQYSIKGAITDLQNNKRAKMLLRSQLAYKADGDKLVVESEDGIDHIAKILKLVAGYIGASIEYDEKTSSVWFYGDTLNFTRKIRKLVCKIRILRQKRVCGSLSGSSYERIKIIF